MMNKKKERPRFFERLKKGLEESIQHARGELALRTVELNTPVRQIRESLDLSPQAFAALLNVEMRLLEAWESGAKNPIGPALRLIEIIQANPKVVQKYVGMTTIKNGASRTKRRRVAKVSR